MAYQKKNMISQSIEAIKKFKLIRIDEIFTYTPFCRATFYNWRLDKLDEIKKAIESNRIEIKAGLRKKWYESNNPLAQIALYKLIATPEEYDRLSTQKLDHTSKGESIKPIEVNVNGKPQEANLKQLIERAVKATS